MRPGRLFQLLKYVMWAGTFRVNLFILIFILSILLLLLLFSFSCSFYHSSYSSQSTDTTSSSLLFLLFILFLSIYRHHLFLLLCVLFIFLFLCLFLLHIFFFPSFSIVPPPIWCSRQTDKYRDAQTIMTKSYLHHSYRSSEQTARVTLANMRAQPKSLLNIKNAAR